MYSLTLKEFYDNDVSTLHTINFIFYDMFKLNPLTHKNIAVLCNKRLGQATFRKNVITFYKTCIISQDDYLQCQACHIIEYSKTQNNSLENGLLLNYNNHNLFDKYLMCFKFNKNLNETHDEYEVILNEKIKNNENFKNYHFMDKKKVKIYTKSKLYLEEKFKIFMSKC